MFHTIFIWTLRCKFIIFYGLGAFVQPKKSENHGQRPTRPAFKIVFSIYFLFFSSVFIVFWLYFYNVKIFITFFAIVFYAVIYQYNTTTIARQSYNLFSIKQIFGGFFYSPARCAHELRSIRELQ